MSAITRWVLRRKAATVLITVLVICLGAYAVTQLQEELFPNISFPYLFVTTVYPGAGSQVVADQVSRPIESAASQLAGVQQVRSTSLQSYSIVTVQFDYGTNVDTAEQQLTTKLRTVALPVMANGAEPQPAVSSVSFSSQPILYLTVQGNSGQTTEQIAHWANTVAQPALSKVGDVGNVQVVGDTSQQVTLTLNPISLATHGLSAQSVISTLQADGVTFAAGTADIASQTVPVRVQASFTDATALGNIVLAPASIGASAGQQRPATPGTPGTGPAASGTPTPGQFVPPTPVRLKDVATIQATQIYPNGISRTNGQQGVLLTVYQAQTGNTVRASDGVLSEIEQLNKDNSDYRLVTVFDQAQAVRDAIAELIREGLLGAAFAVIVIFLFLRNVRSTLVTAISIPTSILVAFILLWTQGISLNTLTLGGLAIAVGRVVDDAIVVLENIYRHVQQGDPVSVAVREGTREVASAITSSTLTTVGVFLPLGFIGGIVGQAFLPFALTVTYALAASLLVALTVVPVFAHSLVKPRSVPKELHDTWLQRGYTPVLRWSLGHRWTTLLLAFVLCAATIASVVVFQVPTGFLPNSNTNLLLIMVNTSQGADQSVTTSTVSDMEQVLASYAQQGKISLYETTIAGTSSFERTRQALLGSNTTATMLVTLPASQNASTIAKALRQDLTPDIPAGGSITVTPANNFSSNTLSYVVQGPDAASVKQASDEVLNALRSVHDITNLKSDVSAVTPQIVVTPDPSKSALANTALIGAQLGALLQGQSAGTITFSDGTQAQVLVQVPTLAGTDINAYISSLQRLPLGGGVTLGDVATVQRIDGVTQVTRINQALAATVSADITSQSTGPVTQEAAQKLADLTLPAGVTLSQSGIGQEQGQAFSGLGLALLAAVALVYLVMVITFGSLLEPFAILFSLPLAAIGGLGALVITRHELDISSLIGFLMLIGIVVTNAIVLMDLVNQLRKQGYSQRDALLRAGRTRVRPILMTAVATILALLPLALGLGDGGGGSIIAADLGVVVIGGLLTSTLLTLVVVPVVYSLLDGLRTRLRGTESFEESLGV